MAPRLPPSKLHLIRDMIESQSFTTSQMAEEAECTKVTIINIRRNLRQFGNYICPANPNRPKTNYDTAHDKRSL